MASGSLIILSFCIWLFIPLYSFVCSTAHWPVRMSSKPSYSPFFTNLSSLSCAREKKARLYARKCKLYVVCVTNLYMYLCMYACICVCLQTNAFIYKINLKWMYAYVRCVGMYVNEYVCAPRTTKMHPPIYTCLFKYLYVNVGTRYDYRETCMTLNDRRLECVLMSSFSHQWPACE